MIQESGPVATGLGDTDSLGMDSLVTVGKRAGDAVLVQANKS